MLLLVITAGIAYGHHLLSTIAHLLLWHVRYPRIFGGDRVLLTLIIVHLTENFNLILSKSILCLNKVAFFDYLLLWRVAKICF